MIGFFWATSCNESKSSKRKRSPRIKSLSKIVTPRSGTRLVAGQSIAFEVNPTQDSVGIDSIYVRYGAKELGTWKSQKFDLVAPSLNAGNQRLNLHIHLSNGQVEKRGVSLSVMAPTAPVSFTYRKINTYPHNTDAYTQGLIVDQGNLLESTGQRGESFLRRVELGSGKSLRQYDLEASYFGEGITIIDGKIYMLTWTSNLGFIFNKDDFSQIGTFNYPTEGWGLTNIQDTLVMSDGTENIYFIDPQTFTQVKSLQVYNNEGPVTRLNELEFINDKIYANIYETDLIAIIDPATGFVTGLADLAGIFNKDNYDKRIDVLNGIAYDSDNDKTYVTGKWWPELFEIEFVPDIKTIN